jgi:hypothetical protein
MLIKTFGAAIVGALLFAGSASAMTAPPDNDDFADAKTLEVGREYVGSVREATAELGEPAHYGAGPYRTAWYRYRATSTGRVTIEATSDESSQILAAYTGSEVDDLTSVTEGSGTIRFKAHKGRTYRIVVSSWYADVPEPGVDEYKLWLSDGGIKGKGVALAVDPSQSLDSVRSRGLRMHVTARRRVPMAVALRVSRATARRLGLHSRLLGRTHGTIDYNQSLAATIRLNRAARRALADVGSLRGVVKLTLPKSTSPDKTLTVPVSL